MLMGWPVGRWHTTTHKLRYIVCGDGVPVVVCHMVTKCIMITAGICTVRSCNVTLLRAGKPLEDTVQECAAHAPRFHLSGGGGGEADDLPSGLAATERWNVRKSVEESQSLLGSA